MRLLSSLVAAALLAGAAVPAHAQLSIVSQASPVTEDFTGFTGAGFASAPAAGQLDSDTFSVTGLSDGPCAFGATCDLGDFARGPAAGAVTSGGIYAFTVDVGNIALGAQPTGADFNPGSFIVRVDNNTGDNIDTLDVDYTIAVFNDGPRSNTFNFAYGFSAEGPFIPVGEVDFASPLDADAMPAWVLTPRSTTLSGLLADFGNGASLFLQFTSVDNGGTGARDQFGLANISVEATSVPVELMQFSVD